MFFVISFVFGVICLHGTNGQFPYFTSWKEPPIDSGIGEGNATVVVQENGVRGTSTGIKFQALGGTGSITYAIIKQPSTMFFAVGGLQNDEVTISSPIDYETDKTVIVTVVALDESQPQKTGSAIMTIFISDVNDNAPVFQQEKYEATIAELSDIGMTVTSVSASDADGSSPNNNISYSIAGENIDDAFGIDSESGSISVKNQLVFSRASHYDLTVLATDGGLKPNPLTATTNVMINVTEVDKFTSWSEPPIKSGIGSGTTTLKVRENLAPGTSTGIKLQALGGNGTVNYTINHFHGQGHSFSIGGQDKDEVILEKAIDFEANSNLTITIQAEDSGVTPKTGRATMTILIDDVNDNAPVFQQKSYTTTVSLDAKIGMTLITMNATDNDGTSPNNEVTYSLSDGYPNIYFAISSETGKITLVNLLSTTRKSTNMTLHVLATDRGTVPAPLTGTATVFIDVKGESTTTVFSTTKRSGIDRLTPCLLTIITTLGLLTWF